jgi:hypothetical protein
MFHTWQNHCLEVDFDLAPRLFLGAVLGGSNLLLALMGYKPFLVIGGG